MISLKIVLLILFIHWVADFIFQSSWMAANKSKNDGALLLHTSIYSLTWILPLWGVTHSWIFACSFAFLTFIFHTLTDYYTSRLTSKLYAAKKVYLFFMVIGFDQFLHFTQLLSTYYFLLNGF